MKIAPLPPNEKERLDELRNYDILDTESEPAFESMVRLARNICGTAIAAISLVDERRQWFKAIDGLDVKETSRDVAFCAHTILQDDIFIIPDAREDERFFDNPLVQGAPGIRFYAGVPLITKTGAHLGTLCVIDDKPRDLSESQQVAIKTIAESTMAHLELRLSHKRIRQYVDDLQLAATIRDSAMRASRTQQRFLQSLTDNIGVGVVVSHQDIIRFVNPEAARILGYEPDELLGMRMHGQLHVHADGADIAIGECEILRDIHNDQRSVGEYYLRAKDGRILPVLQHSASYQSEAGEQLVMAFQDMTERRQAAEKLQQLSMVVEQSPENIVITNPQGEIEYVNQSFLNDTGYHLNEIIGQNPRMHQSGQTPKQTYTDMWSTLLQGHTWKGELHNRRKDGSDYHEMAIIFPIRQQNGQLSHYVAIKENITDKKRATEEINRLSYFDGLTLLPNRAMLIKRLNQSSSEIAMPHQSNVLILINLDRFKNLNDVHGQINGDRILGEFADRLRDVIDNQDMLARLGGDEFAILLPHTNVPGDAASSRAVNVTEKIRSCMRSPFNLTETEQVVLTACLGVTFYPNAEHDSANDILRRADTALHRCKDAGGNSILFFEDSMSALIRQRFAMENELRDAIARDELRLFLQPQFDCNHKIISAEVLVRWQHPERGLLPPGLFIPLAEESDLIVQLGDWVLDHACRLMAHNTLSGASLHLSVNVSPRQFHQTDFVPKLQTLLKATGADPAHLILEITEGLFIHNPDEIIAKMNVLRELGIHFSLDDFGTGFSSLSYLKQMPVSEIKIDKSFVQDITVDVRDAALVRAILAVAENLDLQVVAEGVETQAQADFFGHRANFLFQGYLFGKPAPAEAWLDRPGAQ